MAQVLSGSFKTTSKNNRHLVFSWSGTQDITKNETTITWEVKCAGTATNYNKSAPFYVEIDGEQVYHSTTRIELYVGTKVASGTKTIKHNSNGAKSFTAKVKAAIYDASYNVSGSGSFELKTIPRGAVITKVPTTFTDEDSPTINFTNYLGNSVDSVSVCLSLDNYYSTIPYRAVNKTATSYKFVFTDEEKAKIYQYTKETNSLSVSFYILTVINGEEYRNKMASTLKIVNADPEITSFTAEDTDEDALALTGDGNKMIWGMNNIHLVATPLLKKGATLDYAYIQENKGGYIEGLEGDIPKAYSPLFEAYVRDSRGNEVYRTVELEYIDYIPLTCNLEAEIGLSDGDSATAEIETRIYGNYFNNSFGAVDNTLSVKLEYNGSNGGYVEDIITLTSENFDGNTYEATITQDNLSYQETWVVKAIVMDYITSATKESKRLTALPVFDWSKEDFNFNVPVSFSAGIDLPQNLLHTDTGRYFHDTQSLDLINDKRIINQTTGYIIVWQYYSGGKTYTENINYTYVPKCCINYFDGKITLPLAMDDGSSGSKTLYVVDNGTKTTITGHTKNDEAPNNKWVLKYIIGY